MVTISVGPEEAGVRLDRIVRKRLPLMALSDIYALIRKGDVRINQRKKKQDYRLAEGDQIDIDVDQSELAVPRARIGTQPVWELIKTDFYRRNFCIIYEDSDLLACNKPAGLAVHPGTGHMRHDTLIDLATSYLLSENKIKEGDEPALVHRLDRDTSGVILITKNKRALRQIHEAFRSRSLDKQYLAICHNRPPLYEGIIEVGLSRTHGINTGTKMKVDDEHGALSLSRYKVCLFESGLSRIEIMLETGKTHQIRVHLAHVGSPIVGDLRYGNPQLDTALFNRTASPRRLYLHAHRLSLTHPLTGKKLTVSAPVPPEFAQLFAQGRY